MMLRMRLGELRLQWSNPKRHIEMTVSDDQSKILRKIAIKVYPDQDVPNSWNPAESDTDAILLALKLGINIDAQERSVWHRQYDGKLFQDYWGGEYDPSWKKAVVRLAIEMC